MDGWKVVAAWVAGGSAATYFCGFNVALARIWQFESDMPSHAVWSPRRKMCSTAWRRPRMAALRINTTGCPLRPSGGDGGQHRCSRLLMQKRPTEDGTPCERQRYSGSGRNRVLTDQHRLPPSKEEAIGGYGEPSARPTQPDAI